MARRRAGTVPVRGAFGSDDSPRADASAAGLIDSLLGPDADVYVPSSSSSTASSSSEHSDDSPPEDDVNGSSVEQRPQRHTDLMQRLLARQQQKRSSTVGPMRGSLARPRVSRRATDPSEALQGTLLSSEDGITRTRFSPKASSKIPRAGVRSSASSKARMLTRKTLSPGRSATRPKVSRRASDIVSRLRSPSTYSSSGKPHVQRTKSATVARMLAARRRSASLTVAVQRSKPGLARPRSASGTRRQAAAAAVSNKPKTALGDKRASTAEKRSALARARSRLQRRSAGSAATLDTSTLGRLRAVRESVANLEPSSAGGTRKPRSRPLKKKGTKLKKRGSGSGTKKGKRIARRSASVQLSPRSIRAPSTAASTTVSPAKSVASTSALLSYSRAKSNRRKARGAKTLTSASLAAWKKSKKGKLKSPATTARDDGALPSSSVGARHRKKPTKTAKKKPTQTAKITKKKSNAKGPGPAKRPSAAPSAASSGQSRLSNLLAKKLGSGRMRIGRRYAASTVSAADLAHATQSLKEDRRRTLSPSSHEAGQRSKSKRSGRLLRPAWARPPSASKPRVARTQSAQVGSESTGARQPKISRRSSGTLSASSSASSLRAPGWTTTGPDDDADSTASSSRSGRASSRASVSSGSLARRAVKRPPKLLTASLLAQKRGDSNGKRSSVSAKRKSIKAKKGKGKAGSRLAADDSSRSRSRSRPASAKSVKSTRSGRQSAKGKGKSRASTRPNSGKKAKAKKKSSTKTVAAANGHSPSPSGKASAASATSKPKKKKKKGKPKKGRKALGSASPPSHAVTAPSSAIGSPIPPEEFARKAHEEVSLTDAVQHMNQVLIQQAKKRAAAKARRRRTRSASRSEPNTDAETETDPAEESAGGSGSGRAPQSRGRLKAAWAGADPALSSDNSDGTHPRAGSLSLNWGDKGPTNPPHSYTTTHEPGGVTTVTVPFPLSLASVSSPPAGPGVLAADDLDDMEDDHAGMPSVGQAAARGKTQSSRGDVGGDDSDSSSDSGSESSESSSDSPDSDNEPKRRRSRRKFRTKAQRAKTPPPDSRARARAKRRSRVQSQPQSPRISRHGSMTDVMVALQAEVLQAAKNKHKGAPGKDKPKASRRASLPHNAHMKHLQNHLLSHSALLKQVSAERAQRRRESGGLSGIEMTRKLHLDKELGVLTEEVAEWMGALLDKEFVLDGSDDASSSSLLLASSNSSTSPLTNRGGAADKKAKSLTTPSSPAAASAATPPKAHSGVRTAKSSPGSPLVPSASDVLAGSPLLSLVSLKGTAKAHRFVKQLEDGVLLCELIRKVCPAGHTIAKQCRSHRRAPTGSFLARDNIANFLRAARGLGVGELQLFDTDDVVEGRRHKRVLTCLLAVAKCVYRYGVAPPTIVQYELEIEEENKGHDPESSSGGPSSDDELDAFDDLEDDEEEEAEEEEEPAAAGAAPAKAATEKDNDREIMREVHVRHLDVTVKKAKKKKGRYKIKPKRGGKAQTLIVRRIRGVLMVRVGGGWEPFASYAARRMTSASTQPTKLALSHNPFEEAVVGKVAPPKTKAKGKRRGSKNSQRSDDGSRRSSVNSTASSGSKRGSAIFTPQQLLQAIANMPKARAK